MTQRHYLKIAAISAIIMLVVMALDYLVNVVFSDGAYYSPVSTFIITLIVAPSFTYALVRQGVRVERAQQELAAEHAARIAADDANSAKSRFLANMSHELRTPLNAIIGYSEMIEESADETNAADARKVQAAARHLLTLIDDVLDQATIEAGKLQLKPALAELKSVFERVVTNVRDTAAENRNRLVVECEPDIGLGYLDASRFEQCLLNLASNAVKFTQNGEVTLRLSSEETGGRAFVRFDAIDTGVGISTEALEGLFKPFAQDQQTGARLFGGVGLGLAITKSIVEAMSGEISVTSAPGKGSTFTLRIPRAATMPQHQAAA
ncbi:MAG: HAMP domain-containing sensor histidine kinase [Hyphomonadaceae bacterium]|nr:HAMP domain-containing sensor histidine kinase [Hyphomonadaceae bacterium]